MQRGMKMSAATASGHNMEDFGKGQEQRKDERLGDSPFTVQWFFDTIKKRSKYGPLVTSRNDLWVQAEIINEDKGMMSKIYKCDVFDKSGKLKPLFSTILKIPGTDAFLNSQQTPEDSNVDECYRHLRKSIHAFHARECDYFDNLNKILDAFPVPEAIAYDATPSNINFIMLEYVPDARSNEMLEGLSINQLKQFTRMLAKFHYKALMNEPLWRGKYEMVTHSVEAMSTIREKNFEECCELLKEKKLEKLSSHLQLLEPVFKDYSVYEYLMKQSYKDKGIPSILCHGDAWANNILWKLNPDDSLSDTIVAVLDWQWLNEGNPGQDLAKLLAISTDTATRKQAEEFLCDFYYDELTSLLKPTGRSPPYSLEQFKRGYWLAFVAHMGVYVVLLPKMLITGGRDEKSNIEHYVRKAEFFMDDALRVVQAEFPQFIRK